jgi:hypothetical protein
MEHPEIFYKYLAPDVALKVLSSERLRWSSPLLFDDPAEFRRMPRFDRSVASSYGLLLETLIDAASGSLALEIRRLSPSATILFKLIQIGVQGGMSFAELRASCSSLFPNADQRFARTLNEWVTGLRLETARVLCVTTDPHSDQMWDRYANGGTGAVLGFRHVSALSTPLLAARKVFYAEAAPSVGSGLNFLLYGDTPELREKTFDAICFTKMASWSYQHEWRALTWRPPEYASQFGDYLFHVEELESITCGHNSSHDFRTAAEQVVRSKFASARFSIAT